MEKGDLIRIKNGYYAVRLSDFSEEELIARLFPDCVLNLETALYAYGYLNRKALRIQIVGGQEHVQVAV